MPNLAHRSHGSVPQLPPHPEGNVRFQSNALPRELIDDRQDAVRAPVRQLVSDKISRPALIRSAGRVGRHAMSPADFLSFHAAHLQVFFAVKTIEVPGVDRPAFPEKQHCQSPVAVTHMRCRLTRPMARHNKNTISSPGGWPVNSERFANWDTPSKTRKGKSAFAALGHPSSTPRIAWSPPSASPERRRRSPMSASPGWHLWSKPLRVKSPHAGAAPLSRRMLRTAPLAIARANSRQYRSAIGLPQPARAATTVGSRRNLALREPFSSLCEQAGSVC